MDIGGSQRRFSQLGKKVQTIKRLRSFRLQRTTDGRWRRTRTVFSKWKRRKGVVRGVQSGDWKGWEGEQPWGKWPKCGGAAPTKCGGQHQHLPLPLRKNGWCARLTQPPGSIRIFGKLPTENRQENDISQRLWPSSCLFQQICCLLVTKSLLAQGNLIRCTNGHTAHTYSQCHQYA